MMNNYYYNIVDSYIQNDAFENNSIYINGINSNEEYGKIICAMANTAALKKEFVYYCFVGVDNKKQYVFTGELFNPDKNEIVNHLSANVSFNMGSVDYDQHLIFVIEVRRAFQSTIQYDGLEYVINSDDTGYSILDRSSELAKKLSSVIEESNTNEFITRIAKKNVSIEDVFENLNWSAYMIMCYNYRQGDSISLSLVIRELISSGFIVERNTGKYDITNLGALLLARNIDQFETVKTKAVRVLIYSGEDFTSPAKEIIGKKGYLVGFKGLVNYITDHLPSGEYYDDALRKNRTVVSLLSIRETVANALIHQDLNELGTPTILIFSNHIIIQNPGTPLVSKDRFIDTPPRSRNGALAAAMQKAGICEQRGSGYDKIITDIENNNLLAPEIIVDNQCTSVSFKFYKPFEKPSKEELTQIAYNHTCLNYVNGKITNNSSLRKRLHLMDKERYKVSRIFQFAIDSGLIKIKDGTSNKNRQYVPFWA